MPIRLKMKTGLSGPRYSLAPGDEHEFAEYEAKRLLDAGFAERVETTAERGKRLQAEKDAANQAAAERAKELEKAQEQAAAKAMAKAEADAQAKADAAAAAGKAAGEGDNASARETNVEQLAFADLAAARKAYKEALGKNPAPNWSIEQLAAKITEGKG